MKDGSSGNACAYLRSQLQIRVSVYLLILHVLTLSQVTSLVGPKETSYLLPGHNETVAKKTYLIIDCNSVV
jgi:hypothetical protein